MLLKNKITGEIRELPDGFFCGDSLKKVCEEWEDAPEEPKYFYCISIDGSINNYEVESYAHESWCKNGAKIIGNYFETKEEAEQAVRKLKAWKRLKDKGFEFCCDIKYENLCGNGFDIPLNAIMPPEAYTDIEVSKDLDFLFGGEE